jgi:hypothetical protein
MTTGDLYRWERRVAAGPPPKPERRSCNRHYDCDAADERARKRFGIHGAIHCHDEGCEECFGY